MTSSNSKIQVIVPVADGSEDMEFASITDVLVRCGIQVLTISCNNNNNNSAVCTLSRGMKIIANSGNIYNEQDKTKMLEQNPNIAAIVFPGGMPGARHLSECAPLISLTKKMIAEKGSNFILAAICAAPAVALAPNGFLKNVAKATCFPALKDQLLPLRWSSNRVVVSKDSESNHKVITSQGPGTAVIFALQIAAQLVGTTIASNVADAMLIQDFSRSKL